MINVFQPSLGKEELAAVGEVFASNWLGKGKSVNDFQEQFARGLKAAPERFLTTTCCTEGLFLAGELFGFGPEDEIIAPSVSFIAVGNSVLSRKAKLVLCDVDRRTLNATVEHIAAKITARTKAVILNHYGGVPCDMDPILELCRAKGIAVIEDSACAVRSFYRGRAAGTLGDMGTWSFDAMKTLCAGDGGMIYLKSPELMAQAQEGLYLGLPHKAKSGLDSSNTGASSWWEIDVNRFGRRAIMNNVTGAIALVQLGKLDGFISRRRQIYHAYARELAGQAWLQLPPPLPADVQSSYYFFWIQLEKRDELAKYLYDKGVYTTFRYWPLHKVKHFGLEGESLPASDYASGHTLNIPLHQSLTDDEVAKVIDLIRQFGKERM